MALLVFILMVGVGREKGIYLIVLFVVLRGSFEIARMFFSYNHPPFLKRFFVILAATAFLFITYEPFRFISGVVIIFSFMLIVAVAILFHRYFKNTEQILTFVAHSCMGLVYTCLLPATAVWTVQSNNGIEWFLCLLGVVFAGDIGAYIFGVKWGKTKIAPLLSPNKSLEGAVGGLIFSTLIAAAFQFLLPNTPFVVLLLCGLIGGMLGQIGDFFESLIKRVYGVKDSGSIMPGHGGILDRIDGVLLASPLFYLAATYFPL